VSEVRETLREEIARIIADHDDRDTPNPVDLVAASAIIDRTALVELVEALTAIRDAESATAFALQSHAGAALFRALRTEPETVGGEAPEAMSRADEIEDAERDFDAAVMPNGEP
jgi:hypothetical protein